MYLSPHALADALGGISQLIEYYDITTRDTREAVAACIDAACQDHGVSVGKGEPGQRFTFSADVRDLAALLLDTCPVYRAAQVTPTIGTLQVLFRGGVAA